MLYVHTKDQVPGEIAAAKRRWWKIVEQNEISGSAYTQFADTREIGAEWAKDGLDDVGIILKRHVQHQVARHNSWICECLLVEKVRCFHLLHHVHAEAIVSKANSHASTNQIFDGRPSHGIVHVRAGIMYAIGTSLGQATNFTTTHMHSVRGNTAWA